jgi:predicted nucleic acid-binding protein
VKIIVDTNIVFSAILNSGSRIGKILLNSKEHFQFFSCNYLRTEIQRHRTRLLKLTKLADDDLAELEGLVTSKITFIDERLLPQELLLKTETLLKSIDPNDTPFVALATHLEGKLWTGDMQLYKGLKLKRFKDIILTADLSLLLDDLERQ